MANEIYIGPGNDDGEIFGRATEKISFYGASPTAKQTVEIKTTTSSTNITNGVLYDDFLRLVSALKTLGLFNTTTSA